MNDERPQFDDLELLDLLLERGGVERTVSTDLCRIAGAPTLSRAQRRIWFLQQMAPESPAYNMLCTVRLSGSLDIDALRYSIGEIVRRHDALRTCFPATDGRPGIAIASAVEPDIRFENLEAIEPSQRHERVVDICEEEGRRPFDLSTGPLLRLRLLRLAEREHVALLGIHHIVADGWSMGVLIGEFSELYTAFVEQRSPRVPASVIGYADFTAWQEQWLGSDAASAQRHWWIERLAGMTPLELPTDRVRPSEPSYHGAVHVFALPNAAANIIQDIGRREGATLFMTMLAALAVLLHRYSGQDDIVVGSPVANRNRRETEPLIGLFVNSLVMRCNLSGQPTFIDVLRRVRDYTVQALAHQDLPFDEVVKALAPDRDLSANPLFQVMFSVDSAPPGSVELPNLTLTPVEVATGIAKFDLQLNITSAAGQFTAAFEYATDLFDASTILRMAGHFTTLLEAIAADASVSVATLPLLTPAEHRQLDAWNDTTTAYPRDMGLAALFESQVRRRPDAIAVEFGADRLTYQELNARANCLARQLRACGVGLGTTVAIHAQRSAELVVGMVAIVKAGGVYVPLDPSYPLQRLQFMLGNCGAPVLLTERSLFDKFQNEAARILCIDECADSTGDTADPEWPTANGGDLAYIIYTSGSTGRPKGVAVPHRAVARLVLATNYVTLAPDDVVAQASNTSFDAATFEIWGALLNGARLVGIDQNVVLAPSLLASFVRERQIMTLFLTTALFNQVAREVPDAFRGMRNLLFGGEQVDPHSVREVLRHGTPQRLLHVYGPTENTTFSTWKAVRDIPPDAATVPIGKALSNTRIYALDANRQRVPIGVPGELYLGGDGLAHGYYNDLENTAEAFVANPFDGGRTTLYRTGDMVRQLPDGDVEFLGRRDSQVKIRGYRIEPGEIESVLLRLPTVREAAVLARQDRPGHIELVAYVTGAPHETPDPAALRQQLSAQLPSYMVPARFVVLVALPLNANGKVDRKALPAPPISSERAVALRPPRDPRERSLADAWADVLGCTDLGIDDNYFELGGDSITAIQVVSRLRRLGWQLRIADLFRHPTIEQLALQMRREDSHVDDDLTALAGPVEVPLTAIQRWFLACTTGNANHFNQAVLLRVSDALDEAALRRALSALLERHDALRLRLAGEWPDISQFVTAASQPADLIVSDLRFDENPSASIEQQADAIQRGLDLRNGPLLKAALFRCADGDRVLLVIHHMAVDAVSWRILLEELEIAYRQALANHAIELGARTCSFRRWATAVRDCANGAELAAEVPYWAAIESAEVVRLPVAEPVSPLRHGDAETVSTFVAPEETTDLLTVAPRAFQAEAMDVLLTALGRALKNWSGGTAMRVTLEGHGREPPDAALDLSNTVGWFTSLYPFVLSVPGDDIDEQIEGVRCALRQVPRKGFGYGILRYISDSCERSTPGRASQLCFNYLGQFEDGDGLLRVSDEPIGPTIAADVARAHALDLTALVTGGHLLLSLDFDPALLARAAATALLDDIRCQIGEVVRHGRKRLATGQPDIGGAAAAWAHLPVQGEVQDAYPLSPLQQGLLFQSLLDSGSAAYFVQVQFEVGGALDEHAFQHAWSELCVRHAVLRSAFVHEDLPQPLQVVLKERIADISFTDHRDIAPTERIARFDAFCRDDRSRGFDLRREPLLRIAVFHEQESGYRIVWSYHHILIDGWCLALLQRDFIALYAAYLERRTARLPPAPPYRRYIDWLGTRDRDAACKYWRHYLQDYDRVATLPKSAAGGDEQSRSLGEQLLVLDDDESAALIRLASRNGVTLSAVLRALWGLLLTRYNDRDDVVFGTIVSGRPAELAGIEEMVGLFIAAIPVRVKVQPHMTFAALVRQLQDDALAGEPHHYLSLADIQSESTLGRALFDHMLIFENYPMRAAGAPAAVGAAAGLSFTPVAAHDPTHYDLDVTIAPGDRITIKFTFDRRVHSPDQMQRTADHLHMAVTAVLQDPERPLHEIAILPPAEEHLVLRAFNATDAGYSRDLTCVALFEEQAATSPEAVAVVCGDMALTYRELDAKADHYARYLRQLGVGPEVTVGLCVERTPEMIVGPLAIWKAGGVFVPLSPDYPRDRLSFMIAETGVTVLLTLQTLSDRIPDCDAAIVFLDTAVPHHEHASQGKPAVHHDTSYVIFTSGSTGRPKGVAVTHSNLANMAHAWRTAYGLGDPLPRLLQIASFSFDVFIGDLVRALCHGGTLVVCPTNALADPAAMFGLMAQHCISIFEATPAVVLPLMDHIDRNGLPIGDLKILIVGSDVLPVRQFRRLMERFGDRLQIFNSYGVTEATIDSSCFEASDAVALDLAANTPIGKPLGGVRLYVLDRHGRPQPLGIPGELYIGGAGVARGYVNRPELTATRYVARPHVGEQHLYRTGDLARWLPDGNMEFLGRIDDQVKIRGYRIEPGEIEDQLLHCEGVRAAIVVAREFGSGKDLVGYVEADARCDMTGLRAALKRTLPDHMVPSFLVRLDRMPLSANGKIDRKALPDPRETRDPKIVSPPPRNATESGLVAIWQQVLQVVAVGVLDDFFQLGGHSLKAMQITAQIHKIFGVRIALRDFFGAPTIVALAKLIENTTRSDQWSHIPPAPQQEHYALSHAQQRLWMLHQLDKGVAYNIPDAYVIGAEIDRDILDRAFQTLIRRHEALRTAFPLIDDEPRQLVLANVPFSVVEIDLRDDPQAENRAHEIADQDANQPFNIAAPPLFRSSLVHLPGRRSLFTLTMHHIIGDGWSGILLYRELLMLYEAYRLGRPDPLRPPRIQYKDFAAWQNARGFGQHEDYWLAQLSGMPERTALPYDLPPPTVRAFAGGQESVELEPKIVDGLRMLAASRRTTVSTVVLALFDLLLFHWTRQNDYCIGLSVANRTHPDTENLIGFFVNILPIRCRPSADMEFDDLLSQVVERTHEALEHQDYPFDRMIQRINPRRHADRQPLVNVVYAFQNFADIRVEPETVDPTHDDMQHVDAGPIWETFDVAFATSQFDLTLVAVDTGRGIRLTFGYDSNLFHAPTILERLRLLADFAEMVVGASDP